MKEIERTSPEVSLAAIQPRTFHPELDRFPLLDLCLLLRPQDLSVVPSSVLEDFWTSVASVSRKGTVLSTEGG